ncbi:CACTA en-spm transposon protein [Cucumis melo var. makuwa]|uniref:CACTA en-spm transposon protein n=1 Tax=Cucumis melo var. makuwa TaxID=1194695 RepID=A0A5A7UTM4_CUCMM|nr:CACTA en-spm transposon protein [Cucumis melo var. makuwa]TYK30181.1 CACTA en-spm transposon protein [Cucumis melo var. makuwa]
MSLPSCLSQSATAHPYLSTMSSFPRGFDETDVMFLEFTEDLDNLVRGSSLVRQFNTSQSSVTLTPKRRTQSRLLELEHYVAANGWILMTIASSTKKPISPHVVRSSQVIGLCVRKTFPVHCLKWVDVGKEYNKVVKADLQMLNTFKEFLGDYHRHFKKYSDLEEARANPPHLLEQSWMNKAARQKQPYNHSSGSKSFLQRQYELAEQREESVDRVELFWQTHVRDETFVSQVAEDAHVSYPSNTSALICPL